MIFGKDTDPKRNVDLRSSCRLSQHEGLAGTGSAAALTVVRSTGTRF